MRIEPTNNNLGNFKNKNNKNKESELDISKDNSSKLNLALMGLAVAGLTLVGATKFKKITFEEALRKSGVEFKDGIATLLETGEKFSGKIERLESRTRKETVEFVDGVIKEKVYHNLLGKPLNGIFYKDGIKRIEVGAGSQYSIHQYDKNGGLMSMGDAQGSLDTKFEQCRQMIKNMID